MAGSYDLDVRSRVRLAEGEASAISLPPGCTDSYLDTLDSTTFITATGIHAVIVDVVDHTFGSSVIAEFRVYRISRDFMPIYASNVTYTIFRVSSSVSAS